MGREHRGDLRGHGLQVEDAGAGHPFVEVGHNLVHRAAIEVVKALDDAAGGVAEQRGLDVVPLPGDGVELVAKPELGENLVLLLEETGEID